jgi:hypothetical protein
MNRGTKRGADDRAGAQVSEKRARKEINGASSACPGLNSDSFFDEQN